MQFGIVVDHPVCDMALQRRIADASRERLVRSIWRRKRWMRRGSTTEGEPALDAAALVAHGEDVWKALRF